MDDRIKELLIEALTQESIAMAKYKLFAEKAKEEGFQDIGNIFTKMADNELEHMAVWFKYLGLLGNTSKNLETSVNAEEIEFQNFYPNHALRAKEYGDDKLSNLFEMVGNIEKDHANKFRQLLDDVKNNKVFTKDQKTPWICTKCGFNHVGLTALTTCPVCSHKQEFFAVKSN